MLRHGKKVCVFVAGVVSTGYLLYWVRKVIKFHFTCSTMRCRMTGVKGITGKK